MIKVSILFSGFICGDEGESKKKVDFSFLVQMRPKFAGRAGAVDSGSKAGVEDLITS